MRIKARALGLAAEDYFNDKVLEDIDLLYTGVRELPTDFWDQHAKDMESWKKEGRTFYRVKGPLCQHLLVESNSSTRKAGIRCTPSCASRAGARGAGNHQGLFAPEKQCLGHHRAQDGCNVSW